jgi:hypothetical protein
VAHACNPRYSGGRRRTKKDHGSKSAPANSSRDPISKTSITYKKKKRAVGVAQCILEFKPQYCKKIIIPPSAEDLNLGHMYPSSMEKVILMVVEGTIFDNCELTIINSH